MFLNTISIVLVLSALGNGKALQSYTDSDNMAKFFAPRIVGGSDAPEGFAPHMAALLVGYHYTGLVCGGSIVSSKLILTAAHCIDMFVIWGELLPTFHAVVGSNRWDRGTVVEFKAFNIHPGWNWDTIKDDIGFLVAAEKIIMGSTVAPIGIHPDRIGGNQPCYVTGWGLLGAGPVNINPYQLQILHKNTTSAAYCVKAIKKAAVQLGYGPRVDPKTEICTFHSKGHGMCHGDSGSGLILKKTLSLIGIVSWGIPCALGFPDMFVRMSAYIGYYNEMLALYK